MIDGSEIQGKIKDIDRKKGLIEYIKVKDADGKKHRLDADEIKFMYLPPNKFDKLGKAMDAITDTQKWTDEKLDQDLFSQGYVYFELSDVKIKKKNKQLLMQLLNPNFSKKIKIYHDPFAKESMSLNVGGLKVAGGHAKSYYIAKTGETAYRMKKKNYKKEDFNSLWKSCDKVTDQYPDKKWSNLTKHVVTFSESNCN